MTQPKILVKYCCIECEATFLVDEKRAKVKRKYIDLVCPWCEKTAQGVVSSNPDDDIEDILDGCLWPS